MKKLVCLVFALPIFAVAQKVEVRPVDVIYGNQLIHGKHQVVLSSPKDVAVIPVQKEADVEELGPSVVISASTLPYIEEGAIAKREQAIYEEINKRTEENPFTVLFTGNIPEKIQEKRLRMMPEIGVFGDQTQEDIGEEDRAPTPEEQAKLEQLIGG